MNGPTQFLHNYKTSKLIHYRLWKLSALCTEVLMVAIESANLPSTTSNNLSWTESYWRYSTERWSYIRHHRAERQKHISGSVTDSSAIMTKHPGRPLAPSARPSHLPGILGSSEGCPGPPRCWWTDQTSQRTDVGYQQHTLWSKCRVKNSQSVNQSINKKPVRWSCLRIGRSFPAWDIRTNFSITD